MLIALVSHNAAVLPGCVSCHEVSAKDFDPEAETSIPKVVTEFASHKELKCASCHVDNGFANRIGYGSKMTFTMLIPVMESSDFDDLTQYNARCLTCHDQVLDGVVETSGIRIRHSECSVKSNCADCHAGVGHRLEDAPEVSYSMDGCMSCHNSLADNFKQCNTCHVQRSSSERRVTYTNWDITHGPDWEKMHGMGDLNTCSTCHTSDMCGRCHGNSVPHANNFFASHGKEALSPQQNCVSCHEKTFCSNCHGIEMPHPAEYIKMHSSQASDTADKACLVCHSVRDCEGCHAAHVHPGGSIGTIDGTEASRD